MTQATEPGHLASPRPEIADLNLSDLGQALRLGWRDFLGAPGIGLLFSAVYVAGGLVLTFVAGGFVWQTLILALGFPLIAPFAAVGLYETSRRLEKGEPLDLSRISAVVWAEKERQIPWLGAIIVIYFLFYGFIAHMIFALFMGPGALVNVSTSMDTFLTPTGLRMMAVELAVGAVLAFLLFAMTAFSLPLLLDKEFDFVTAMLISIATVRRNLSVLLAWAAIVAASVLAAMVPLYLGLLVALPVLGHATWHLYRRALIHPE